MTRAKGVLTGVWLVLTALGVVFFGRVVQLQVAPGERLRPFVDLREGTIHTQGSRGEIRDRRGRVLATTRFGWRVFVDPERLDGEALDETIVGLSGALGLDAAEVGERLVGSVMFNAEAEASGGVKKRYVRVGGSIDEPAAGRVRGLGASGVHLERVPVREYPAGLLTAAIVGKVGVEHEGRLGIEERQDERLRASDGVVRYVRDHAGRPLWIEPGGLEVMERGEDVVLTIDLEIQRIAMGELERGVIDADAAGGRVIVLDPVTGEILAIGDIQREVETVDFPWVPDDQWEERRGEGAPARARYAAVPRDELREIEPAMGRNRCLTDVYEPGSTFKPFVWTAARELGLVDPDEMVETHRGEWRTSYGRAIVDTTPLDRQTWRDVLYNSSNIGMVKLGEKLSHAQLHGVVDRYGFGRKTGLDPVHEAAGLTTSLKNWSKYTHTSVSYGYEVAVTPLQLARAFSAFARPGELIGTLPEVSLVRGSAEERRAGLDVQRRVAASWAAREVVEPLTRVAKKIADRMERAGEGPFSYTMFGKSGTAKVPLGAAPEGFRRPSWSRGYYERQYNASFVGAAPAAAPRVVVLVVIDDPGPALTSTRRFFGSQVAGPVVRRIAERVLAYEGVLPDAGEVVTAATR